MSDLDFTGACTRPSFGLLTDVFWEQTRQKLTETEKQWNISDDIQIEQINIKPSI